MKKKAANKLLVKTHPNISRIKDAGLNCPKKCGAHFKNDGPLIYFFCSSNHLVSSLIQLEMQGTGQNFFCLQCESRHRVDWVNGRLVLTHEG